MINDRQKVSDDLARLTQQMRRRRARACAHATGGFEQIARRARRHGRKRSRHAHAAQLGLAAQRQFLRSGRNRRSPTICKSWVSRSAMRLARWAARSRVRRTPTLNRAMDDLSRLRDQLAGLGRTSEFASQRQAAAQPGACKASPVKPANAEPRTVKQGQIRPAAGQGGQGWSTAGGWRPTGWRQPTRPVRWAIRAAAQAIAMAAVYGGVDTGNTRITGQAVAPQQGPNPADTQRQIDQGLNLLNQVRAAVQDSPEARQQLQALIEQMRNLDPKPFPRKSRAGGADAPATGQRRGRDGIATAAPAR